jgi:hypothetical protein
MKVFISWSGTTSRSVAEVLSDWLPKVIQGIEPFLSAKDIDKGANWTVELARELEDAEFGIVCLAPDNLLSPWLNYETGAITKSVNSRVSPVLFGVEKPEVQPPMSQLQLTEIDQEEFLLLLGSINKVAGGPLDSAGLREAVDVWWPRLETALSSISVPNADKISATDVSAEPAKPTANVGEMMEEILHRVRNLDDRVRHMESRERPLNTTVNSRSKYASALKHLKKQFELVSAEVSMTRSGASKLEVHLVDTLPDPLPIPVSEAGRDVARVEGIQVQFISPDRVITFGTEGEVIESQF